MTTKFDIASAALVMVGASPVTSFTGDDPEQLACNYFYDTTVKSLIESHPWRWASKTTLLSRNGTAPDTEWDATYTLPTDCLSVEYVALNDLGNKISFNRYERKIYCNATSTDEVYAAHTYLPSESVWPEYFKMLAYLALAEQFAFSLAAKLDLAENLGKRLETKMRMARSIDSKQQTSKKLETMGARSLISNRRS